MKFPGMFSLRKSGWQTRQRCYSGRNLDHEVTETLCVMVRRSSTALDGMEVEEDELSESSRKPLSDRS